MKVLLVNGSHHQHGTTDRALKEVAAAISDAGIETEVFWIGKEPVHGCYGCYGCAGGKGRCVFGEDIVNTLIDKAKEADGFVFGTPVHFASAAGSLMSVLDRAFYAGGAAFGFKPGAAVACARRAGTSATLDILNKYFTYNQMPVVSSQYWNMVFGNSAEEAEGDLEGLQTMQVIGKNMAWLLGCIQAGKDAGIHHPEREKKQRTNFIR